MKHHHDKDGEGNLCPKCDREVFQPEHWEDSQGHVMYGDVFFVENGNAYCIICSKKVKVHRVRG